MVTASIFTREEEAVKCALEITLWWIWKKRARTVWRRRKGKGKDLNKKSVGHLLFAYIRLNPRANNDNFVRIMNEEKYKSYISWRWTLINDDLYWVGPTPIRLDPRANNNNFVRIMNEEKCKSNISGVEAVLSILALDANQRWFMPTQLLLLPTPPSPIAQPLYLQMHAEHLCLTLYALAFWDPGSGSVSIAGSWFGKRTRGSSDFNSHIVGSVAAISYIT